MGQAGPRQPWLLTGNEQKQRTRPRLARPGSRSRGPPTQQVTTAFWGGGRAAGRSGLNPARSDPQVTRLPSCQVSGSQGRCPPHSPHPAPLRGSWVLPVTCSLGSSCWRQPLFSEGKRQDSQDARSSSRLSPALSAVAERDRDVGDKDEGVGAGRGRGAGSGSCHFYYCHHHRHHWGEVKYSKVINWVNPGPGPEEAPQLSLGEEGPREGILGDVHPSSTCMADWGVPGQP